MREDFENEYWVSLYQLAMMELEYAKITGRIKDTRNAIIDRVERLRALPGLHPEERRAIDDALTGVLVLEQEQAVMDASEKKRILERSLEKLKTIAPAIQKLESDSK